MKLRPQAPDRIGVLLLCKRSSYQQRPRRRWSAYSAGRIQAWETELWSIPVEADETNKQSSAGDSSATAMFVTSDLIPKWHSEEPWLALWTILSRVDWVKVRCLWCLLKRGYGAIQEVRQIWSGTILWTGTGSGNSADDPASENENSYR